MLGVRNVGGRRNRMICRAVDDTPLDGSGLPPLLGSCADEALARWESGIRPPRPWTTRCSDWWDEEWALFHRVIGGLDQEFCESDNWNDFGMLMVACESPMERMALALMVLRECILGYDIIELKAAQVDFGGYRLDFLADVKGLGATDIEVDGSQHNAPAHKRHDEERDRFVRLSGLEVVRLPAVEVLYAAREEIGARALSGEW